MMLHSGPSKLIKSIVLMGLTLIGRESISWQQQTGSNPNVSPPGTSPRTTSHLERNDTGARVGVTPCSTGMNLCDPSSTSEHISKILDGERKSAPVLPKFRTSSDLLGAIDLCLHEPPERCYVLHLTPSGIFLDMETPTLTPRIQSIVTHLRKLNIRRDMTFVFYTADTVSSAFRGLPVVTHTMDNHTSHLLFPTPYLLRDLENGHLKEVLRFCDKGESLLKRRNSLYFRGRWRDPYRVKFARYAQQFSAQNLEMDVGLIDLPTGEHNLTMAQKVDWKEKAKYQYLLTLKGGWSSQWEVYHDYVSGGLIVRDADDKREYWNYDIVPESTVNFQTIEKVADAILDPTIQSKKEAMAKQTRAWACFHLQPQNILGYSQSFVDEYAKRFGGIINNRTYSLQRNRTWAPQKIQILF